MLWDGTGYLSILYHTMWRSVIFAPAALYKEASIQIQCEALWIYVSTMPYSNVAPLLAILSGIKLGQKQSGCSPQLW